jgi:hypothetical protein
LPPLPHLNQLPWYVKLSSNLLPVTIFLLYCAYHMDYHWDCHLYFIIIPSMHRLYSYLLTCSTLYMTHNTTDTSSTQTMTWPYYACYLTWWLS